MHFATFTRRDLRVWSWKKLGLLWLLTTVAFVACRAFFRRARFVRHGSLYEALVSGAYAACVASLLRDSVTAPPTDELTLCTGRFRFRQPSVRELLRDNLLSFGGGCASVAVGGRLFPQQPVERPSLGTLCRRTDEDSLAKLDAESKSSAIHHLRLVSRPESLSEDLAALSAVQRPVCQLELVIRWDPRTPCLNCFANLRPFLKSSSLALLDVAEDSKAGRLTSLWVNQRRQWCFDSFRFL